MKNLLMSGLLVVAVASPVAAQAPSQGDKQFSPNMMGDNFHRKTVEEWQEEQDREKAYKSGMNKIPDQKVKNDPWGAVRTTPPPSSSPTASNQRPASK
jgi:Ni/Co efflux regulator RcnB